MRRQILVRAFVALLLLLTVSAGAQALMLGRVDATGYYQILSNDPSGAVVRAWVRNTSSIGAFALVNVFATSPDGNSLKAVDAVFVPARTVRPADVTFSSDISNVNFVIATRVGGS